MNCIPKTLLCDFLQTMTANPKWDEVLEACGKLPSGKQVDPSERPDIIARVFYLKLKSLIADLKGGAFGEMENFIYVVEYQKRGMC